MHTISVEVAAYKSLACAVHTPDDVLDKYPVDRLMHDIALALMAVQTQTTNILDEFPTKAAKTEEAPQSEEIPLF